MRCKSNPVTRALHKILIKAQGGNGAAAGANRNHPLPSAVWGVTPFARISPNAHPG